MEGILEVELWFAPRFLDQLLRWGALRMVNNGPEWLKTFDNGPEWSPGALGRVSGGPKRGFWRSSEGAWTLLKRS